MEHIHDGVSCRVLVFCFSTWLFTLSCMLPAHQTYSHLGSPERHQEQSYPPIYLFATVEAFSKPSPLIPKRKKKKNMHDSANLGSPMPSADVSALDLHVYRMLLKTFAVAKIAYLINTTFIAAKESLGKFKRGNEPTHAHVQVMRNI